MRIRDKSSPAFPRMTAEQLAWHRDAVAEEEAGKGSSVAMARKRLPALQSRVARNIAIVEILKQARVDASLSLDELQQRTGMQKSALSRLENSKNPNPTLATMIKYADAIGVRLDVSRADN